MRRQPLVTRIVANIALFGSILFLPWWVSLILILFLLAFWEAYEVLVWGFLLDALYSGPIPFLFIAVPVIFTLLTLILFVLARIVKQQLIFYY